MCLEIGWFHLNPADILGYSLEQPISGYTLVYPEIGWFRIDLRLHLEITEIGWFRMRIDGGLTLEIGWCRPKPADLL